MSFTPLAFAYFFLLFLVVSTVLRLYLGWRHMRHIALHRAKVPSRFTASISLAEHQKAADYSIAKTRNGLIATLAEALLLLIFTFGGGLQALFEFSARFFEAGSFAHSLLLFACYGVISFIVDLPLSLYRTFRIEARFGFNQMSFGLWLTDLVKSALLGICIGTPLLLAVLWLMGAMGEYWWLYVWCLWMSFNLLILFLYPTVIAPLFNKFLPLDNTELKARIEALLSRCGFTAAGLFVMDGSKRSAHGNAYFTGFGKAKRIVFFDTLLNRLEVPEIEAVLAHELGHFKHKHVIKRIALLAAMSFGLLWLLGLLINQPWFYLGLGVSGQSTAMALLLFSLALPVIIFPIAPLSAWLSRRHEYEADAYAARQTQAPDLVSALIKLYRDNASTLTPDPLHSLFYDSHPPAALRIAQLLKPVTPDAGTSP